MKLMNLPAKKIVKWYYRIPCNSNSKLLLSRSSHTLTLRYLQSAKLAGPITFKPKFLSMRTLLKVSLMLFAILATAAINPADAQKKKKGKKGGDTAPKENKDKDAPKPISEVTKNCVKYEGLFTIYQDTLTGKSYLEITDDQMENEYIYFSVVADGVLDAGFFRGSYRGSKVISFKKHYQRIEVHTENTSYYFDEDNALHRASDANINTPIIISEKIAGKDSSSVLIDGDAIFLSEKFSMIKPPSDPKRPSMLGGLSKDKTKIQKINNYPENSEITVDYVYENKNPRRGGSSAVTDVRNITIQFQHSLVQMPENDFQPRADDPRLGYFMTQVNDMTSFSATPYRDMIHRWNLVKKDPGAAISDPVEPITWWIENTTPEELRPIIKEGVERWNFAFEKAGFSNAVVVKIQPDDAEWDAGDIRYNVLRWTSSPQPPFGGYGPSFVNPRTGEILGADIMLEFSAITNRLFRTEVFELAGYETDADYEVDTENFDPHMCSAGQHLHHTLMFGMHAMRATNMDQASKDEFTKQGLYRLVLHEVGHTLGLMHNMRASTLQSVEDIKNKSVIDEEGLCNSVMEYPSINYALNDEEQTLYYDVAPGAYDHWVIEYGYSEALSDDAAEAARLEAILSRSNEPDLMFGNDADDMRSSGRGIDPDVNIYDLSDDPVAYASERCELVNVIMPKILDEYTIDEQSYHELRNAYFVLTGEYGIQMRVMTRQIGGVHYDRSYPNQDSGKRPYEPVSEEDQKAAMAALAKYAFAPDAFNVPEDLYNHLQHQRRGFNHFVNNEDPRIHGRILSMQKACLSHLLHPNVTTRILDSEVYGNTYTLDEVMTDLTDAIFKADLKKNVNTVRQNLQVEYVKSLININGEKSRHSHAAKGMAIYELNRIKRNMQSASSPSTLTKAHRQHIIKLINDAMNP